MHVILLQLAIDPVCSLVFDAEPSTPAILRESPRKNASLFGRQELLISLVQGLVILITAFSIYYGLLQFGYETTEARASAFIATILGNLGHSPIPPKSARPFWRSALYVLEHFCFDVRSF